MLLTFPRPGIAALMPEDLIEGAAAVLREAAATAVLPRFRALAEDEIEEKMPGELVTIADREAETIIAAGLAALLPGSIVIGEEACAADPALIGRIGEGRVWIVDPIDGTAQFTAGELPFAVMAALMIDGETVAALILDPVSDRLAAAERGSGAWLGGERLQTQAGPVAAVDLRGSIGRFMPPDMMAEVLKRAEGLGALLPGLKCAGAEYPAIASAERDFALYWRTLAWDHAPGVLFLNEAGGKATRPDGSPYVPGSEGKGLLAARTPEVWDAARSLLLG